MQPRRFGRTIAVCVAAATLAVPTAAAFAPVADASDRPPGLARALAPSDARQALLHLINRARRRHGVRPVQLAGGVSREADRHSARMATDGRVFSSRTRYPFAHWGENVSCGRSLEQVHAKVMSHRDSRANVLHAAFRRVGIGVARSKPRRRACRRGTFWVTEVFFSD
jgi:uncharacterized protein YkwD